MKKFTGILPVFACTAALAGVFLVAKNNAAVADDPYAPLKLYDGKWDVMMTSAGKDVTRLEDHCVKTGLFFECEQVVDGKPRALVVFLPFAKTSTGGEEYRTQVLRPDATTPGNWEKLTIEGDRWVYSWETTESGKKLHWHNINTFSGPDKIHFEIQSSEDEKTWKTQNSGDEQRVK